MATIKMRDLIVETDNNFNWKTNPLAKDAKTIYHGEIFTAGGDYFFTVKDKKLWKFEYGFKDTKHYPYVKFIKKVNDIKFPSGDNDVEYKGKKFGPLGKAALYKLKNGKILWEF